MFKKNYKIRLMGLMYLILIGLFFIPGDVRVTKNSISANNTINEYNIPYGEFYGIRSVNQMWFSNQRTCRLAGAYNNALNKFPEVPYTLIAFEYYMYNIYPSPMPPAGSTMAAGAKRIDGYLNSVGYDVLPEKVIRGSKRFNGLLERGEMLMVTIQWNREEPLLRGYFLSSDVRLKGGIGAGHAVNIIKEDGVYYIINSRYPYRNKVRLDSLNHPELFKTWEGAIYLMRTNRRPKIK